MQAEHVDGDGVKMLTQTMINVTVLDVNDNCPLFVNTPYIAAVTVGAEKHVPFIRVSEILWHTNINFQQIFALYKEPYRSICYHFNIMLNDCEYNRAF